MNTKKIVQILIILAALLIGCVGCGGENEPSAPASVPPTSTPAATPTLSAGEHLDLGMDYHDQGELDKAIAEFEKAIELDPNNAGAHRNLGTAYGEQGKWEESAAAYERAIDIDPTYGEAYGDVVGAYFSLNRIPEALTAGEKAIELAPYYATAYNNLGILYGSQGQIDTAIALFEKAIELDPNDANAHYNLGFAYENLDQLDQAVAQYQEAVKADPDYLDAYENMGTVFARQGRLMEAITQFETFLELAPSDDPGREQVESWLSELKAATEGAGAEYTNAGNGYSISYPNGWYNVEEGNRTSFAESKEDYQSSTLESPLITILVAPLEQTAESFGLDESAAPTDFLLVMTGRVGAQVEVMDSLQIAGYPAAVAATSGTVQDSPYSGNMIMILVEERIFLIEAIAPPEQWDDFRPTFVDMVNSLTFFEPGG
jgi:tetratricopeptide (TPR) repeat protein